MFIRFENITNEVKIDVRTKSEFKKMPLFDNNIPVIDEQEHKIIKKIYPIAFFIIGYGLYKRKKYIKSRLLELSDNRNLKIVIACSRGRLRSPVVYFYAKYLGINCKVVSKGLKRFFEKEPNSIIDKIYCYFKIE
ncbi:MAG: hypothetical protein ACRCYE_03410 [Sarcina sp.]